MPRTTGLTLVELLTALAVAAVLVTTALPAFLDLTQDNRLTTQFNQFLAAQARTRSEAVKRGGEAVICNSSDGHRCAASGGWEQGWIIFQDRDGDRDCHDADGDALCADGGALLQVQASLAGQGITIRTGASNVARRVVYFSDGTARGYMDTFRFCDARGTPEGKGLRLLWTGRLRPAALTAIGKTCP